MRSFRGLVLCTWHHQVFDARARVLKPGAQYPEWVRPTENGLQIPSSIHPSIPSWGSGISDRRRNLRACPRAVGQPAMVALAGYCGVAFTSTSRGGLWGRRRQRPGLGREAAHPSASSLFWTEWEEGILQPPASPLRRQHRPLRRVLATCRFGLPVSSRKLRSARRPKRNSGRVLPRLEMANGHDSTIPPDREGSVAERGARAGPRWPVQVQMPHTTTRISAGRC